MTKLRSSEQKRSTVWRVLSRGWKAYADNVVSFILIHIFWGAIVAACMLPTVAATGRMKALAGVASIAHPSSIGRAVVLTIVLSLVILPLLYGGLSRAYIRAVRGQTVRFGDLFSGVHSFGRVLIGFIVVGVSLFGGALLLILPGIVLGLMFSLTFFFIVDKDLAAFQALGASWNTVGKHFLVCFIVFLIYLAVPFVVSLLGRVPYANYIIIPVNWLVITPFTSCSLATLYVQLTTTEAVE